MLVRDVILDCTFTVFDKASHQYVYFNMYVYCFLGDIGVSTAEVDGMSLLVPKEKNPKVSLKLMNVETCARFDKFGAIFSTFSAKTFSVMNKNA